MTTLVTPGEDLAAAFAAIDKDGNGTIEPSELKEAFSKKGVEKTDEEIAALIGADGVINQEKFIEIMSK